MKKLKLVTPNQSAKDFSGLDFTNEVFKAFDFHESIFNGTYFTNVTFIDCDLRHTEFTEARFSDCSFVNAKLDYSDFVFVNSKGVSFERSSFAHAEWRENTLVDFQFIRCSFDNATISLCVFTGADFDEASATEFFGASKRFNVFTRTGFKLSEDRMEFLRLNYGLELGKSGIEFVLQKRYHKDPFLLLSLAKFTKKMTGALFTDLIVRALGVTSSGEPKNQLQRIKYLSLICKQTIDQNLLPVLGEQFLINSLNAACKTISNASVFMEIVDLIMYIKSHQYRAVTRIESETADVGDRDCRELICELTFNNSYTRADVQGYLDQMAVFLDIPEESIRLMAIRSGSTMVEFIINHSVTLASVLVFINFSLSQVNKILENVSKAKKNIKSLVGKKGTKGLKNRALMRQPLLPLAIMSQKGSLHYDRMNRVAARFERKVLRIEGSGDLRVRAMSQARGSEE